MLESLFQVFRGYQLSEILVELAVIWAFVYLVIRFLRGTRGAGIIKGVLVVLVVLTLLIRVLGQGSTAFGQLNFIYNRFLEILTIALIVVFQPELRQAMIRLGQTRWFGGAATGGAPVIDAVVDAVELLSKSQFGALIAIERSVKLGGLLAGGEELDARVSSRLLGTIFWPNSPLHDLGVVIRGDRIVAANVQFPLAEDSVLPSTFGSRHRAALGLTLESDCIVVAVSEETGRVSIAQNGRMDFDIPRKSLREELITRLRAAREEDTTEADGAAEAGDELDVKDAPTADEGADPSSSQTPPILRIEDDKTIDHQPSERSVGSKAERPKTAVTKEAS